MAYKSKYREDLRAKTISCSCGGKSSLKVKTNYPFGKKSKAVKSAFYKCEKCGVSTFIKSEKGGKRR